MTPPPAARGASPRWLRSALFARAPTGVTASGAAAAAAAAALAAVALLGVVPTRVVATSAGRTWKALPVARAPPPREETAFTPCGGAAGRLCLLGGRGSPPSSILTQSPTNPWGWTWTSGPPPPLELHHFQGAPRGRCVYAAGAYSGAYPTEVAVPDVWAYCDDAADGGAPAWRRAGAMPPQRARGSAGSVWVAGVGLVVVGGVVGGHGGHATAVRWVDVWDGVEREDEDGSAEAGEGWTRLPDLPRARDHFSVVAQGGELWVAGGRDSGAEDFFNAVIPEVFSFSTNTWRTLSSTSDLPTPRAAASTVLIDGGSRLLLAGGEGNGNAYNVTEALTLRTGVWERLSRLVKGRHGTGAAVCGGTVYVAAGSGGQGGSKPNLNTLEGLWAGDGPPPRCGGGGEGGGEETITTPSPPPPVTTPVPPPASSGGGGSVSEPPSPNPPTTNGGSSGSGNGAGSENGGDNSEGDSDSGSVGGGGSGGVTGNDGGGGSGASPTAPPSSTDDSDDGERAPDGSDDGESAQDGSEETESACFPAAATVQLASGVTVTMDALRVGDVVLDVPAASAGGGGGAPLSTATTRVLFFTHADGPSRMYPVVVLSTVTAAGEEAGEGNRTTVGRLTLSPGHLVVTADGRWVPASAITVGTALLAVGRGGVSGSIGGDRGCDAMVTAAGACAAPAVTVATVTGVAAATAAGRYNPQTASGTLLVDGHVVSAYTSAVGDGAIAHAGVRVLGWAVAAAGGWGEGKMGGAGGGAAAALAAAVNLLALRVFVPTVGWVQRGWAKSGWEGGALALAVAELWQGWAR